MRSAISKGLPPPNAARLRWTSQRIRASFAPPDKRRGAALTADSPLRARCDTVPVSIGNLLLGVAVGQTKAAVGFDDAHFRRPRETRSAGQSDSSATEMIRSRMGALSPTHKKSRHDMVVRQPPATAGPGSCRVLAGDWLDGSPPARSSWLSQGTSFGTPQRSPGGCCCRPTGGSAALSLSHLSTRSGLGFLPPSTSSTSSPHDRKSRQESGATGPARRPAAVHRGPRGSSRGEAEVPVGLDRTAPPEQSEKPLGRRRRDDCSPTKGTARGEVHRLLGTS